MNNKSPLGIRLNNPSNIRYSPLNHWIGQRGQSKGFCKFDTIEHGIRALLVLLRTYRYKYGLKSVRQIVSRFAPPNENNTESYIQFVLKCLHENGVNVDENDELYFDYYTRFSVLRSFAAAICKQETGFILSADMFFSVLKTINLN